MGHSCHCFCSSRACPIQKTRPDTESTGKRLCFTSRAYLLHEPFGPRLLARLFTGERREDLASEAAAAGQTRQTLDSWVVRRTDRSW